MRYLTLSIASLLLAACGGGGGSSPPPPPPQPPPPPSIAGVWDVSSAGSVVTTALIDQGGRLVEVTLNSNGCNALIEGQLTVNASAFTGAGLGAFVNNCTAPDGSTGETWTDSGTFVEGTSITETLSLKTANGTVSTTTNDFSLNAVYDTGSALSSLAGNWADGTNTVSITANGVMTEQNPTTGCVLNGQVSIIDATKDLYGISMTWSSCTGSLAVINGVPASGLGTLYASLSPEELLLVVSAAIPGAGTYVSGGVIKLNGVAAAGAGLHHEVRR